MSIKGHSHFAATNSRSGRMYRIDSFSFPTGHFDNDDLPAPVGNWSFSIHDGNCRHPFSRTAAHAYVEARNEKDAK